MATNGNFKFVGSIIAGILGIVVIIYNLVYSPLTNAISKEADARVIENKQITADVKIEDARIRTDFLLAINGLISESKIDREKITDKLEKMGNDITAIKVKIGIIK